MCFTTLLINAYSSTLFVHVIFLNPCFKLQRSLISCVKTKYTKYTYQRIYFKWTHPICETKNSLQIRVFESEA